jgi:hypothetical protein
MEHESAFSEFCQETEALFEKKFDRLRALILRRSAMSNIDGEAWYNLSNMGALLGDPAIVTANLRKAIEGGFFNYPLMKADPVFESVRGKPEFERTVALARTKYEAFKSRYPELQEEK